MKTNNDVNKNLSIDTDQVNKCIDYLWPWQETGYFAVSSKSSTGLETIFFPHPIDIPKLCNHLQSRADQDTWYSIGLIGETPQHGRGSVSDVVGIPGFVLDVDCAEGNHKKGDLPSKRDAWDFLFNDLPRRPSFVVDSGGGFHSYYVFKEPWIFEDQKDKADAIELSSRWQRYVIAKGKRHGWDLDNCGSLEHLFRLPGTYNHKGLPVKVKVVTHD